MERVQKERKTKKVLNRILSYVILAFAVFAICFSVDKLVFYVNQKNKNEALSQTLAELKEENEKLEITNAKLKDRNYFSVYVKGKYQYSSKENKIEPLN